MSGRFSRVPIQAAADRRLGATELRVLIAICAHVGPTGRAFPSLATIARIAGLDRRKVPAAITKLETCGWLTRTRRGSASTEYDIHYPAEVSPPEVTEVTPPEVTPPAPPEVTGVPSTGDRVSPPEVTAGVTSPGAQTAYLFNSPSISPERGARGTRFPADSILHPDWRKWAQQERPDVDPEPVFDRFKDYWIAKPGKDGVKANWTATWRNWIRKERSNGQQHHHPQAREHRAGNALAAAAELARELE